jgi:hypothetical protein
MAAINRIGRNCCRKKEMEALPTVDEMRVEEGKKRAGAKINLDSFHHLLAWCFRGRGKERKKETLKVDAIPKSRITFEESRRSEMIFYSECGFFESIVAVI